MEKSQNIVFDYNNFKKNLYDADKAYGQISLKDTCIFIASHIRYDNQINLLDKCLKSLINQKCVRCNIYLSISFEVDRYESQFTNYHNKNRDNLRGLSIFISKKQLYQLEHYKVLSNYVSKNYKYILFCDDDDTYNMYRISILYGILTNLSSYTNIYAISDNCNKGQTVLKEYWSYLIKSEILQEFFKLSEGYEDLFKHKFADMYLSMFLQNYSSDNNKCIVIPENLYNYNKYNKNSITNNQDIPILSKYNKPNIPLKINKEYFRNGIILYLIIKKYNKISDLFKLGYNINIKDVDTFVPEKKRIIELSNILYANDTSINYIHLLKV